MDIHKSICLFKHINCAIKKESHHLENRVLVYTLKHVFACYLSLSQTNWCINIPSIRMQGNAPFAFNNQELGLRVD